MFLNGYKSYGFAAALAVKGILGAIAPGLLQEPVTFENMDNRPAPAAESNGTDILLAGAIASLRRAIGERK